MTYCGEGIKQRRETSGFQELQGHTQARTNTQRQRGNFIRLALFLQNYERRLEIRQCQMGGGLPVWQGTASPLANPSSKKCRKKISHDRFWEMWRSLKELCDWRTVKLQCIMQCLLCIGGTASQNYTIICMIWDLHSCDYEECCLLGCYATWHTIPEDGILHYNFSGTADIVILIRKATIYWVTKRHLCLCSYTYVSVVWGTCLPC
jgi:hypothetical protein